MPTTDGYLISASNNFTVTGERAYSEPVKIGLSVIRVTNDIQKTSVRADVSGTKSFADESVEQGRALVHPRVKPKVDDLLIINDDKYEIKGVRPLYDMYGGVDHYQVELTTWV